MSPTRSAVLVALGTVGLGCVTPNRPILSTGALDGSSPMEDAATNATDSSPRPDGANKLDAFPGPDSVPQVDTNLFGQDVASTTPDTDPPGLDLGAPEGPRMSNPPGPPFVTVTPRSPTNNTKPTWTWMSAGNGGSGVFRYRLDVNDLSQNATTGIQSSFTPPQALTEGSHTLYVQERNAAGDWSASGVAEIIVDVTPPKAPVFLAVPRSPLNSVLPTWKWMSGGGGDGTYRYKLDDANVAAGGNTVTMTEFTPVGELTESVHTLFVQERDAALNWSVSSSRALVLSKRGPVGPAGFSSGAANWLSLKFNAAGVPHVAFSDEGVGGKAVVRRFDGITWETLGSYGFSPGLAGDLAFAISPMGVPYVGFSADLGPPHVMRFGSSGWETVGAVGFSAGTARGLAIAFGSDGNPFVSFSDEANMNHATVMRFTGTAWTNVGKAGFSPGEAGGIALALTKSGIPHVCFNDGDTAHGLVMRLNGTTWESVGPKEVTNAGAQGCSLAFDSNDVPYIAFDDGANAHRATVLRLVGGAWQPVGKPGFSPNNMESVSLSIDKSDVPYVAFTDLVVGKVVVMRFDGALWESVGPAGLSVGSATSLALSPLGVPFVAFRDDSPGQASRVSVLKTSFDP